MNDLEYINNSGRRVLKFFQPDLLFVDLHFILTQNKILIRLSHLTTQNTSYAMVLISALSIWEALYTY